jgi:hypothetical protein
MPIVKDLNGKEIVLNDFEKDRANKLTEMCNELGFEVDTTSLTSISKLVSEQKFYEIKVSDYMPVLVGNGAWGSSLLTYRSFQIADSFETGLINTGASNSRLAEASAGIDSVTVSIKNWAKQINYTLFDLQQASKSGNWSLVQELEVSRKTNWDLGIQSIAFVGSNSNTDVLGLLTQPDVTANTTLITQLISSMSASQFNTFVAGVVAAYRVNSEYTAKPTHFAIPEVDYNGLVAPVSETYPMVSKLEYLLKAFQVATNNPNFKIMPLAYGSKAINAGVTGLNKNRYALYNYSQTSLRMDIPVDYTNTMQNTLNGFQFQNVGYGQFTGAKAYRSREMLYFDWG